MLTSNQRGRGHEPVTVLGSVRSAVAVNMGRVYATLSLAYFWSLCGLGSPPYKSPARSTATNSAASAQRPGHLLQVDCNAYVD